MSIKSLKNQTFTNKSYFNSINLSGGGTAAPVITSIIICDSNFNNLDDTALAPGGSFVKLVGTGFKTGCTVYFNNESLTATFISSSEVRIQTPATTVGSYNIMLFNPGSDGGAIYLNLSVSNAPTWTTNAGSLGTQYETTAVNTSVSATGDTPIVYSLFSGNLPAGTTLSSNGTLSGTAPAEASSTTYSFTVNAKDAQNQDTTRTFSLTINVDVVSWTTPTSNQVISSYEYSPISNVTLLASSAAGYSANNYSANALPTGITLAGNTISGTANSVGNTFTRLTSTSNTSGRSATRDIVFNVNQDVVTWSSPADGTQYTLSGGSAISNVSLSATSAAGRTINYTANALPSGLTLNGSTISGTPTTAQTVTTLLTATASTTNRSATRTISWSISLGDLNWKNATLALNATQPTTPYITDSSNNNTQLSIFGDTRPSNFNPYQQGYYSNYFNGSSTGLTIPGTNGAFAFGTGNFTIEFWAYSTAFSGILCSIASSWSLRMESSGAITWYIGGANGGTTTSTVSLNTWNHFAVVRTGTGTNQFVIYVNGQPGYTNTRSDNITSTNTLYIGVSDAGNSGYYPGHISNFRVIKGTALYTGAFTPSTTPLTAVANTSLLTCQDNRFIDDSPNNLTITRTGVPIVSSAHPFTTPTTVAYNTQYSTFFDGTGDYLTVPNNTALQMSSGDFTIEFWINYNSITGYQTPLSKGYTAAGDIMFQTGNGNGALIVYLSGSAAITESTGAVVGQWYHYALVRSGTTVTLYRDGVSRGTATSSVNFNTTDQLGIGATGKAPAGGSVGQYGVIGCMSNVRVVKGTALYSGSSTTVANFTVPTVPLTAVANTSLLTCQNATLIDNSTNAFTITSAGQAQPIALSPFTMTTANTTITSLGSAYFDGTGDYLTIPASPAMALGSGDFTIEAWIYTPSTVAQFGAIICNVNNPDGFYLSFSTSNFITFSNYGTVAITSSSAVPLNTWTHVAVTRSGTSLRMFFNGVSVGSATNSTVYGVSSATNYIGFNGGAAYYTGYIADCRVIKGTALYTSNFLPPQIPLTAVANTQLLTVQTNGGATNNAFVDQSSFNNLITRTGNATQGTFSPYSQTGWSNHFDGSGDYLSLSASVTTSLSGTYTIESWCYLNAAPTGTTWDTSRTLLTQNSGASIYHIWAFITTGLLLITRNGAAYQTLTSTISWPTNQWFHVAITNVGTTVKLYINGSLGGSLTQSAGTWNTTAGYSAIGSSAAGTAGSSGEFNGYISNFRIVNGTEVYTTNFTPPTAPLTAIANTSLLTCTDNRFIDESPNNFAITGNGNVSVQAYSPFGGVTSVPTSYSTLFTRSSTGYLSTPASSAFAFGTGAYTIEAWAYFYDITTYRTIFNVNDGTNGPALVTMSDGSLRLWNGALAYSTTNIGIVTTNTWYHFAWVRQSTSLLKLYVNGTLVHTITTGDVVATNLTGTPTAYAGYFPGYAHYMDGYISNYRITKGQALYTSNFTPSTSPLTTTSQGATSSNVSLLTCQDNTFKDNSTNLFTITGNSGTKPLTFNPFGLTNTTQVSYSPSVNGGSMYFDGTGDKLTVANYPTLGFKANDFTIQCWFYTNVASIEQVIMTNGWSSYAPWLIRIDTANTLRLNMSLTGGSWHVNEQSLGTVTPGQWYHVAVTRTSGVLRAFTNGVQTYTVDLSTSALYDASQALTIGGRSDTVVPFNGYLSDAQIINGFSLYRANFVPPVAPATPTYRIGANTASSTLLLSGTSGGIIDYHGTNNLETVGDVKIAPENPFESGFYSNFFDGTGDYLTVPGNSAFAFGTGDFTIEGWLYTGSTNIGFFDTRSGASGVAPLLYGTSGTLRYYVNGVDRITSGTVPLNTWVHIALVRISGSTKLYFNGVQTGSTYADTNNFTLTNTVYIGVTNDGSFSTNGYQSNMRVVKGVGVYTSNFTPPTAPLTAITNTSLLTCQSNSFIDNSTNAFTITRNGDVAVRSFNPFKRNTGQSYFFDGTGDYLSIPASPQFAFGTGDYTIEAWVYRTDSGTQRAIVDLRGGSNVNLLFYMNSSNQLVAFNSTSTWITSSTTIPLNQWTHVAITRSGTSARLFINGVIVGTATNSDNNVSLGAAFVGRQNGSTTNDWLGYIDDLRITRGVARYTSNNQVNLTSTFEVK